MSALPKTLSGLSITQEMFRAAEVLREGPILIVYRDGNCIRLETEFGDDPFVWRNGAWRRMK